MAVTRWLFKGDTWFAGDLWATCEMMLMRWGSASFSPRRAQGYVGGKNVEDVEDIWERGCVRDMCMDKCVPSLRYGPQPIISSELTYMYSLHEAVRAWRGVAGRGAMKTNTNEACVPVMCLPLWTRSHTGPRGGTCVTRH